MGRGRLELLANPGSVVLHHRPPAIQLTGAMCGDGLVTRCSAGKLLHPVGPDGRAREQQLTPLWQQTFYGLCPDGPQAIASCVCIKGGMTALVLKEITSSVWSRCGSTATEDVSSAVTVSSPDNPATPHPATKERTA